MRIGQLIAAVATPHRFRSKRQFWSYCGLAVRTRSGADHHFVGGNVRRTGKATTRGLTQDYNRTLKHVFKSAALRAARYGHLKSGYAEWLARGLRPELARVTVAGKIAAITLAVWKKGEEVDAKLLIKQAAGADSEWLSEAAREGS